MLDLFKTILQTISPEDDWGHWIRKSLSYVLIGSITLTGFEYYKNWMFATAEGDQVLSELWEDRDKRRPAEHLISLPIKNEKVKSVWLYAWDELFVFHPLRNFGDNTNPLPLGTWRDKDEVTVGALVLGRCECLDKDELSNYEKAYVCPVYGDEDVWGFMVVTLHEGQRLTAAEKEALDAIAHRISNLFYHKQFHYPS